MEATKKNLSRRSFIGTSATLAAGLSLAGAKLWGAPAYIPNLLSPNFTINGVQLGVITYSFREMENQSAEAILQYVLACGINSIELMGGTAESFNGRPENKIDRRKFYMLSRKARKNELTKDQEKELSDFAKILISFNASFSVKLILKSKINADVNVFVILLISLFNFVRFLFLFKI